MHKFKKLNILTPQGFSGELTRESQYVFNYRTNDRECEIALTMPLRSQSYAANILPGVFRQNLPEGYLYDWIREHFAKAIKLDDMAILAITGRDVIGRVRALSDGDDGSPRHAGEGLREILTWKGTEDLFQYLAQRYAISSGISGVQPKVVIPVKPEEGKDVIEKISMKDRSLIVKSSGDDYPGLAENEFHCMSIAKNAGLEVPEFWLSDDKKLFVVGRFDVSDQGYLGFEDMTSLMNKQNTEKYDSSYEMVAKAVSLFTSEEFKRTSLEQLFSSVVLSVLLRNGDAHLKNFGVLYSHPGSDDSRLSPLYDVVNTTNYFPDTMALKLAGSKAWATTADLIEFGKIHCRVDRPDLIIGRIADAAIDYRPPENSEIWKRIRPEIEKGCTGIAGLGKMTKPKRSHSTGLGM